MIRKLKSGEYRLYSRKKSPKSGADAIWARFRSANPPRNTSVRCNISSAPVDCYKARRLRNEIHLKNKGLTMRLASWKFASVGAALCLAYGRRPPARSAPTR